MSSYENRDYYLRRAKQERDIARGCADNAVALTHLRMADEYDRRAAAPLASPGSPG